MRLGWILGVAVLAAVTVGCSRQTGTPAAGGGSGGGARGTGGAGGVVLEPLNGGGAATQPDLSAQQAAFLQRLATRMAVADDVIVHTDKDRAAVRAGRAGALATETDLADLARFRAAAEPMLLDWLKTGQHPGAAYYLGYLRSREALPALRTQLLAERSFYGWEGPNYRTTAAYLRDDQYPRQLAYLTGIEAITGQTAAKAVGLTKAEAAALDKEAAKAKPGAADAKTRFAAKWLLAKLKTEGSGVGPGPATRPAGAAVVHVVKKGENLTLIAKQYGVTVQALQKANTTLAAQPNTIYVGQKLKIPAA